MNSSSKGTASFEYTIQVEASEAEVEFLETMSYVDLDSLAEAGQVRIEIGTITTDCCRRLVRGVIEKGMLTEIEFEPDEDETSPGRGDVDPGIVELLEAARSALDIKPPSGSLPIPMADLVANPRIAVETWTWSACAPWGSASPVVGEGTCAEATECAGRSGAGFRGYRSHRTESVAIGSRILPTSKGGGSRSGEHPR